jgi:Fe-S cluster biosynthesis and repair protein YggX
MRTVYCHKLNATLPGLKFPPIPGALGKKIFEEISEAAWKEWMEHQTILINEYRLNLTDPKSRTYLLGEMQKFFFTEHQAVAEKPAAYTPIKNK